ncbi:hypothetical protein WAE58_21830 [Pedobacter panaciterrae]|uniref:Uncharacterized protein n=1 Tax=Pedobacter panaciterrae TaxID=363849 RepID=A0ABU8NU09_9SPHI
MGLEIFRGNEIVAEIPFGKNLRFSHGLMNQHKIVATGLNGYEPLLVQLGDFIVFKGVEFKINTVPELNADDQLTYEITFEGPKYTWHDKLFMHEGEAEFTFYGDCLMFIQLFISNINEIDPVWSLGEITDTENKYITFSNVTCHEAIIIIAEAFRLEFEDINKVINMVSKIGRDTGLSFEYGMGKGLYNLTRTYVSDKNVVTKVYGFGGTRNLPVGYRGSKRKLTFDPGYHTNNIDLYGIKEGQFTDETIIPEREAAVTGVTYGNPISTVTDSTLNFNIKDCIIEGLDPKIGFTTGELSGEEFVITDYNPVTKVISFKNYLNSNNIVLPNDTTKAAIGDKYVLFDIELPAQYVTANEQKVNDKTLHYVLDNSVPRVEYGGTLDPIHLRDNSIEPQPGDRVNFKDARIGLNDTIRITEISYPLDFPEVITSETNIEIVISNFVTYTQQQRLRDDKLIERHEVKTIDLRSIELARRNSANLLNLRDLVIDPEGNYFTEKIKPGSIETLYLAVGAKYTNFSLKNVAFNTNAGGNPNSFLVSAGQLVHFSMNIEGVGFVWEMQPFSSTTLVSGNTYYLYAKVSRTTLVGSWILSTDIKTVESEPGFFILQTGVLFPVTDGYRNYELTKGMAFIVGDQITAGVLKSIDGLNFFDMTQGRFKLGDDQNGLDWNVTTPNRLTIRGGLTQNAGGITAPITLFRGAYINTTTYYKGDTVTYNGSTWVYIYPTPIFNVTPAEGPYWTISAQKGNDGIDGDSVQFQYSVNGTTLWHDNFTSGDLFARSRTGLGAWSAAFRIVGEEGDPGIDGKYTDYEFSVNSSLTTAPTTGWQDAPPAVAIGQYLWMRKAEFLANGTIIGTWSAGVRISGTNGNNGTDGSNGVDGNYTEFRFAKNGSTTAPPAIVSNTPNPSGWTTSQPSVGIAEYMWITSAIKTAAGALVANWSTPVRFNGQDGTNGADGTNGIDGQDGKQGPFITNSGDYNNTRTYVGTDKRIEAVKYGGLWYTTRVDAGSFSGILPTNTSKWNAFGAQFDSIATGLLLAEAATITNLISPNLKTAPSGKRMEILASENNQIFYDATGQVLEIDDDSAVVGYYDTTTAPVGPAYPKNYIRSYVSSGTTYYTYATLAAGILFGNKTDGNGFMTLSKKGVAISTGGKISFGEDDSFSNQTVIDNNGLKAVKVNIPNWGSLNIGEPTSITGYGAIVNVAKPGTLEAMRPGWTGVAQFRDADLRMITFTVWQGIIVDYSRVL